jgi:hypothetical protein
VVPWIGWIAAIGFAIWGRAFLPAALEWLRIEAVDICAFALAGVGAFMAVAPKIASKIEENPRRVRFIGILIFVVSMAALYFGTEDKKASKKQIDTLIAASSNEATTSDIATLRGDITGALGHLTDAVNKLSDTKEEAHVASRPTRPPVAHPTTEPSASHAVASPQSVSQPGAPQSIRFTQRRVPSTDPSLPYVLQVIVQTDAPSAPISFEFDCSGPPAKLDFFVAGQGAYMMVSSGVQGNAGYLKIGYPSLTPDKPLVVTISSKEDLTVQGIKQIP